MTIANTPATDATGIAASLVIRPMTGRDLADAKALSDQQQWPHRQEDWEFFLHLGEGLVAERDGNLIGTIMAWRYGADMATIGLVIVTPAAQGQGIGRQLMDAMIERLKGRSIVLNATEEGKPLYRKLGFVETGLILQQQGVVTEVPDVILPPGDCIRPMQEADQNLTAFYCTASGMDRTRLFSALAANGTTMVYQREGAPVGFAMLRRFGRGWVIAPVVAPDAASAKALIAHFLAEERGSFCRIDIAVQDDLSAWLDGAGLARVGTVETMVRGTPPTPGSGPGIFAIAAQALG